MKVKVNKSVDSEMMLNWSLNSLEDLIGFDQSYEKRITELTLSLETARHNKRLLNHVIRFKKKLEVQDE